MFLLNGKPSPVKGRQSALLVLACVHDGLATKVAEGTVSLIAAGLALVHSEYLAHVEQPLISFRRCATEQELGPGPSVSALAASVGRDVPAALRGLV